MSSLLPVLPAFKSGCPLHFRRSDGDDVMMSAGAGRSQRQRQQRHAYITAGKTLRCSCFSLFRIRSLAVRGLIFALPPAGACFSNRQLAFRRKGPTSSPLAHRTTSPTTTRPERKRHAHSELFQRIVPRKQLKPQTTEEENHTPWCMAKDPPLSLLSRPRVPIVANSRRVPCA
ncbi:unnamed protein product [Ectocarpus sp. 13 AM-2016]